MKNLMFLLFIFLTILSGVASAAQYPDSPRDVVVQVKTVPAEVDSPAVRLTSVPEFTLYGDGRLITLVKDDKGILRLQESRASTEEIDALIDAINVEGFAELNDNYLNVTVENLATTFITVRTRKLERTIQVYGFEFAQYQGMIPRNLINIRRKILEFEPKNPKDYVPDKISLYVYKVKTYPPKEAEIENWKVKGVELADYAGDEDMLMTEYKETVLEGDKKKDVLNKLKGKTLFDNPEGFVRIFFRSNKQLYKLAYRPHLPYE